MPAYSLDINKVRLLNLGVAELQQQDTLLALHQGLIMDMQLALTECNTLAALQREQVGMLRSANAMADTALATQRQVIGNLDKALTRCRRTSTWMTGTIGILIITLFLVK